MPPLSPSLPEQALPAEVAHTMRPIMQQGRLQSRILRLSLLLKLEIPMQSLFSQGSENFHNSNVILNSVFRAVFHDLYQGKVGK